VCCYDRAPSGSRACAEHTRCPAFGGFKGYVFEDSGYLPDGEMKARDRVHSSRGPTELLN
jgi:hypothetical protein